jgi:hypothetical protein
MAVSFKAKIASCVCSMVLQSERKAASANDRVIIVPITNAVAYMPWLQRVYAARNWRWARWHGPLLPYGSSSCFLEAWRALSHIAAKFSDNLEHVNPRRLAGPPAAFLSFLSIA